jgi:putative flippase GtrA
MTDTPATSASRPAAKGLWVLLGRHQVASLIATAADFGVMVAIVELFHLYPAAATFVGATAGGITNFQLGRHWIFEAQHEGAAPQALRYAIVSFASAAWNALGEYGLHHRLGVNYLAARVVVAVAVSFLWNFPMQRFFVFRHQHAASEPHS